MRLNLIFVFSCETRVEAVLCANGTYSDIGQDICQSCPLGSYCPSPILNIFYPKPCMTGWYSNSTGASECLRCEPGFKCLNSSLSPVLCDSGTYSSGGASECKQCPAGFR